MRAFWSGERHSLQVSDSSVFQFVRQTASWNSQATFLTLLLCKQRTVSATASWSTAIETNGVENFPPKYYWLVMGVHCKECSKWYSQILLWFLLFLITFEILHLLTFHTCFIFANPSNLAIINMVLHILKIKSSYVYVFHLYFFNC